MPPLGCPHWNSGKMFGPHKTRIMELLGSEDSLTIGWAISTQYQRVTDRRTDGQTDAQPNDVRSDWRTLKWNMIKNFNHNLNSSNVIYACIVLCSGPNSLLIACAIYTLVLYRQWHIFRSPCACPLPLWYENFLDVFTNKLVNFLVNFRECILKITLSGSIFQSEMHEILFGGRDPPDPRYMGELTSFPQTS